MRIRQNSFFLYKWKFCSFDEINQGVETCSVLSVVQVAVFQLCLTDVTNVERLLRFMGAADAAEQMHTLKAFKQVRNQTNRQTNCDTANLGKTARANAQTLKAIRFLEENDALRTLPEVLQEAAAKRMQNPDLSLTALCGCFDPPVSKSGLSHRMKKLEALAETLRQNLEQEAKA